MIELPKLYEAPCICGGTMSARPKRGTKGWASFHCDRCGSFMKASKIVLDRMGFPDNEITTVAQARGERADSPEEALRKRECERDEGLRRFLAQLEEPVS